MYFVLERFTRVVRLLARVLGFSALGALALTGLVAFRHLLATPQPLDSFLPGEAHLYRWKYGHISYKVTGEYDAPSMVLLHSPGLAGSAHEMREIMAPLAARYRVYAPDLLGFGLSDRPDIRYTPEIYTQLLRDFLTSVVAKPAILVASHLACNYAITIAVNSPDLCKRLVLLSPTALYGHQVGAFGLFPPGLPNVLPARIIIPKRAQALFYPLLVAMARMSRRLKHGQSERIILRPSATRVGDGPPDYMYATTHQFGAEHAPMEWLAGNLTHDVSTELEKLQQPTLIIWGTGELRQAQPASDTSLLHGADEDIITHTSTNPRREMVLLQQTTFPVYQERAESVVETILQWDTEPVTHATQASPTPAVSDATNAADGTIQPRIEAYCVKCKEKRAMLNAREVTMKNGRFGVQGVCAVCGSSLFRIGRLIPGFPQTPI